MHPCVCADQYSPTIWPLTVSLSLGLSLFKSNLWSVERDERKGMEREHRSKCRDNEINRKWEKGWKKEQKREKEKKKGFISVSETRNLACVAFFPPSPIALYHLYTSQSLSLSLSISPSFVCRLQLGCAPDQMVWSMEQPRAVKISLSNGTETASVQMQRSNIWQISVQSLHYSTQS